MLPTNADVNQGKKISIVVFEDAVLTSISGSLEILMGTNRFMKEMGKKEPFRVELVSEKMRNIQLQLPAQFMCHTTFEEVDRTDLILVPSFIVDPETALSKNGGMVRWIHNMRKKGTEVASMCRGSYFLAEAGVLEGKPCTSHWRSVDDMQAKYPGIKLLPDVVITDQDGVYTSGGAFSSIHLILYLVEKFCGREVGIQISKLFSIDMDRVSQSHFAVFRGQREHGDKEVLQAQLYIEENFKNQITVEEVAEKTHMSKRNFIRRFKKATRNTPIEYIQRVKIEAAKKRLETSRKNVNEIMFEVGYSDVKSFRNVFRRITGLSPTEYRNKYNRELVPAS